MNIRQPFQQGINIVKMDVIQLQARQSNLCNTTEAVLSKELFFHLFFQNTHPVLRSSHNYV